tara:strand:- start:18 stop:473 length:456 start_codon:yes stop_codon:yes gene_type:complete
MNLAVIKLGITHLNACITLDKNSLKGLWTKSQWERELTDTKRICLGVIELETKTLLGLCSAWLAIDELHITSIAVNPKHQREGIGRLLISDLIKRSKPLGAKNIYLEVKQTNQAAKAFYKSIGFKIIGNRSNFYKDGSDALILNKQLNKNN